MFNIGPTELIVILIIALIVFGPKRLPEIGRTLGRSLQEFRRASNDLRQEFERSVNEEPSPTGAKASPTPPAGEQGTDAREGASKDAETTGTGPAT